MAKVDEKMEVREEVIKDCVNEVRPMELREVDFGEFKDRMLELEFTKEEAKKTWDVLVRR